MGAVNAYHDPGVTMVAMVTMAPTMAPGVEANGGVGYTVPPAAVVVPQEQAAV
jgi:hypothetical protein